MVLPIVEPSDGIREYISWLNRIADKWRRVWEKQRVYESSPSSKPKFFVTAAFPYPNGMMHLGHARTYTLTDIYARFKRLIGFNVLFPMGFHYTGTPILAMADKIRRGDRETIRFFKEVYGLSDEIIDKMKDPMFMVRFFHEEIKESMKIMGYSIDWRREFTSIDPDFSSFIRWQFIKLQQKGFITRGTHPVGWDPVVGTPVSSHDTSGDVEPEIGEYTLLFFTLDDGTVIPAATLRPETVFGAVNIWVNPNAVYVEAVVDGRKWIISKEAALKLSHQLHKVRVNRELKGVELLGLRARNPATGWRVPVLPADFVDPGVGTGIVMSVPAHAPYDYAALRDVLKDKELLRKLNVDPNELKPIPVVEVPGVSRALAIDVVEKKGITSQKQRDLLDEATYEVYSIEYKRGRVIEDVVERIAIDVNDPSARKYIQGAVRLLIAGKPVAEAREATASWLRESGYADKMYEIMNGPVYSRWGNKVIVKILENQWFIDYGKGEWKELARKALAGMRIIPADVRKDFEETIEWVKRRACARTRGLGTRLPWDQNWVIESLSDSTIYMAFYTVNYILRRHGIQASQLTEEVWDYILLGKGNASKVSRKTGIPEEVLIEARNEFNYWYPLDSRHSAKDLVKNHLTFFIFNHVAVFPEDKWPGQIVVYGYVLYHGEKMSKSKYNVIPVRRLAKELSPDGLRLAIALISEIDQDLDFREEHVYNVVEQLRRIHSFYKEFSDIIRKYGDDGFSPRRIEDQWILSLIAQRLDEARRLLEESKIRAAANIIFYVVEEDLKKYINILKAMGRFMDNDSQRVIAIIMKSWIKAISPYTPYFAEEIWSMIGGKGLIVRESWPNLSKYYNPQAQALMGYVERLISDIKEIIRVKRKKPDRIIIHVASPEEYKALAKAIEYIESGKSMKEFVREFVKDAAERKKAGIIARKIYEIASSLSPEIRNLLKDNIIDEKNAINSLKKIIESSVEAPIEVYYTGEEGAPVIGRRKDVLPLKPAIYISFTE